ncbi:pentapeptide repeat-containing protein [Branchiibius sp. NY16-3462-2]|uniref:WD40 domain-containing protein n=1 Tax=Branchiibius sp. NY16-3462-2 TaxID=1807500 RepID=UPI000ADC89D7|nr:pentapeptide repeat-containing protein [Branchiibius sp. NY16-3462-2]
MAVVVSLDRDEVGQVVHRYAGALSVLVASRLTLIAGALDNDGLIRVDHLLMTIGTAGASMKQDAFRKFRNNLNGQLAEAGSDLRLVVDDRKAQPSERFAWFEGTSAIDDEVSEYSARVAQTAESVVETRATVLTRHRRVRVYLAWAASDASTRQQYDPFVKRLKDHLATSKRAVFEVVTRFDMPAGVDQSEWRMTKGAEADVAVALASPAFLASDEAGPDRAAVRKAKERVVAAWSPVVDPSAYEELNVHRTTVLWRHNPYTTLGQTAKQTRLLELVDAISAATNPTNIRRPSVDSGRQIAQLSQQTLGGRADQDPKIAEAAAARPFKLRQAREDEERFSMDAGDVPALEHLLEWAIDSASTQHAVLLGDLGMGKTTTVRALTRRLLGAGEKTKSGVLPLLLDLRDVRAEAIARQLERDEGITFEWLLTAAFSALPSRDRPDSVVSVIDRIGDGGCVVIVDGLDEVLVHLKPTEQIRFTQQVWRAVGIDHPSGAQDVNRPSKVLLTCRTHYFRTVADEAAHFTGQDREGPRSRDYVALLLLPFSRHQIHRYLVNNADLSDERATRLIDAVGGSEDLLSRPVNLAMIRDYIEDLERMVRTDGVLREVDLYANLVRRWLDRDDGKHRILAQHKPRIARALAAAMWRSKRTSWSADEVEQWLVDYRASHPGLMRHYPTPPPTPAEWASDLRTATFLSRRRDDQFEFAHRSFFEFFLAEYFVDALDKDAVDGWDGPLPSPETFDFVGQLIAGNDTEERLAAIRRILTSGRIGAATTATGYVCRAHLTNNAPVCSLAGVALAGADLRRWRFAGGTTRLNLRGAQLRGASLRGATFQNADMSDADLAEADLGQARFIDARLDRVKLDRSNLVGTIFRWVRGSCTTEDALVYRTQAHFSPGLDHLPGEWLRAPDTQAPIPAGETLQALTGHSGEVQAVAYHPDGYHLATAATDGTVRIWEATTGETLQTLTGHTDAVQALAYHPDGHQLATTSTDGTARIWNPTTGENLHTLPGHTNWVQAVAYHPGGHQLATGYDGTVRIWDATTGEPLHTLPGYLSWVQAVAYHPDGHQLATGYDDGTVRIWDATTGEALTLPGHSGAVQAVAYHPNGHQLAASSIDGTVRVCDATTGETLHTLDGQTGTVQAVAYHPNGHQLATRDGRIVRIWDSNTGETLHILPGQAMAYRPDGHQLATGYNRTVMIWDATTWETLHTLPGHTSWVHAMAYHPNGHQLATAATDGLIRICEATTGKVLHTLDGHTGTVQAVAYHPNGHQLATGYNRTVRICDANTGATLHTLDGHTGTVQAVAYHPNGHQLATGYDRTVRICDATTGKVLHTLDGHTGTVQAVAYHPNGHQLATAATDGTVRICDATTGKVLHTLDAHTGTVQAVAYHPNGHQLATAATDGTVRICDATSGETLQTLPGHSCAVQAVAYHPSGHQLATSSTDGIVRIWDAITGQPAGWRLQLFDDGLAVWAAQSGALVGVAGDSWGHLGYSLVVDGRLSRLPAETLGPLPQLTQGS